MTVKQDRAPGEGYLIAWSGSLSPAERDAQTALRKDGVRVEQVPAPRLSATVAQRAPDLIVLAQQGEERAKLVEALAEVHPYVPVVALTDAADARPQPRARFGMVARLDRDLPLPELTGAIRELLDGFSRRLPRWRVQADLDDIPQVARRAAMAGRSGLLSATGGGAVALDSDGRIGPDPKLFVASLVGIPELELTLYERPPGSVRVFREPPPAAHGDLTQARVLLVDPDPSRFAPLAEGFLEFEGVKVVSCTPAALAGERALDPMAIVVSSETLLEPACTPLWEDARFVPGGLLVLEGGALTAPVDSLAAFVAGYAAPERAVVRTLRKGQPVAARLETLGTARWLKVLGQCRNDVTLRVFSAAGRARVDLSEGKIQGASFHLIDRDDVEGRAAVEMLLRLPFGRVLAGPPASLARFDGMRRARRPSIVGRIVPMEVRGGKIMSEVVVQHTDATVPLFKVPKPVSPPGGFDAFEEEEDEATRTYSSDAMAELRDKLADDADSEAEPTSPAEEETSVAAARREDAAETAPEASDPSASDPPASDPSVPKPAMSEPPVAARTSDAPAKKKKKKKAKKKTAATGAKKKATKKRASKRPPGEARSAKANATGSKSAASERKSARGNNGTAPAKTTEARPSLDRVTTEESGGHPMIWVAAVIALALAGYGVYRLSQADASSHPRAPTQEPTAVPAGTAPEVPTPTVPTQVVPDPPPATDPRPRPEVRDRRVNEVPDPPPETVEEPPVAVEEPVETPSQDPVPESDPAVPPSSDEPLPPVPTTSAEITERIQASAAAARVRDYARSEALARLVIEASPRNARAAYRIAVASFRQRHFDEALEWASNAETWNPQDPLPVSLRGDIHMRRGNFNRAAVAYREALDIEPQFGPARRQLDRLQARGIGVD
ncbi:MAG: hypothetical protein AB8I08_08850 [Sandaracinaceae bacterium]